LKSGFLFKKSRPQSVCGLLFLFLIFCGFSVSSSKTEGRSFPLPGNLDEVWDATMAVLKEQQIPIVVEDKKQGYIQSATFPLYKKEYKEWAKAPTLGSSGFCALEIGLVEKDKTMTIVGIKAYFKRKSGLSSKGFRKRDKTRGTFEGLLGKQINDRLVEKKFPKMKSIILGCNLHYDDQTAHYMILEAAPHEFAYEQGLRNGDYLYKIDGKEITPGNLFDFFLGNTGEVMKKFTIVRDKQTVELPVVIFYLDPTVPRLGFQVERDPKTKEFKVVSVRAGSPAQQAGLLPGDVLLKQNNAALNNWKSYYRAALVQKEGDPQTFQIERDGKLIEKKIIPAAPVGTESPLPKTETEIPQARS
jgi:hypothetical protein